MESYTPDMENVEIASLAFGGEGVGRLSNGMAVFVPYTCPGDTARVQITEQHKNFARGRVLELVRESSSRIQPFCKHFGRCGGCQYQHLSYDTEFQWKKRQLLDCLKRLGGFPEDALKLEVAFTSPEIQGYRNKLRLEPKAEEHTPGTPPKVNYGYYLNDNKTFFTVHECPLADAHLNKLLPKALHGDWARQNARRPIPSPITLRVTSAGQASFYFGTAPRSVTWLKEEICGRTLSVPLGSFWQVNRSVAEALLYKVSSWLDTLEDAENLIDAYSGVGTFSACMKREFAERVLIESDRQAAEAAQLNHAELSLGCRVIPETTEKGLPSAFRQFPPEKTVVILDPPRTGCAPSVIKLLRETWPRHIAYVSCNPATLARDLKALCADSRYQLCHLGMFDMFPRTAHFESAVILEARS